MISEKSNYKIYIGIDTGVKTGFCVWNKTKKTIQTIRTLPIHQAMKEIELFFPFFEKTEILVRVEDARLRKQIPWQKNEKAERGRREGAGYVKRDAVIWEDFLTDLGISFEMVAPKDNETKMEASYFKKLTGYQGVTSQHARDAAALVIAF